MTISTPVQVAGELATAAWANQVRADLVELEDERRELGPHAIRYVPGGNEDGGAGAYVDWLILGNVTVPSYAQAAVMELSINRFIASTTGAPEYLLRGRVGATAEANPGGAYLLPASTTENNYMTFTAYVIAPPAGTQAVAIQVSRQSGTGVIRATTSTVVTASVRFRG